MASAYSCTLRSWTGRYVVEAIENGPGIQQAGLFAFKMQATGGSDIQLSRYDLLLSRPHESVQSR
jgi:hypothetical protein